MCHFPIVSSPVLLPHLPSVECGVDRSLVHLLYLGLLLQLLNVDVVRDGHVVRRSFEDLLLAHLHVSEVVDVLGNWRYLLMSHDWNANVIVSVEEVLLVRTHLNNVGDAVDVLNALQACDSWDSLHSGNALIVVWKGLSSFGLTI